MNAGKVTTFQQICGLVLGMLLLTACAGAAATPPSLLSNQGSAPQPAGAPALPNADKAASSGTTSSDKTAAGAIAARLIVRNATLTLIVDDTQTRVDALTKLTSELGGYVAASSSTKFDAGLQSRVTLRIPSDKFDTALISIRKLAVEVRDEQISGEDVTAEYSDLNAQLKNLEAAELQLREIMSKTVKTEDVLSVFNSLTQKRGEIEQVKGRIQFLSQSASLATVNVTLMPDQLAQPIAIGGWRPEGVLKSAVEALVNALHGIATLVIWLVVVILPVGLILASPFIIIVLIVRSRNKRLKAQKMGMTVPPVQPSTKP